MSSAQEINGLVVDSVGVPIADVIVTTLDGTQGVQTSAQGRFSLTCQMPCRLKFSHVNHEDFYLQVAESGDFQVILKDKDRTLDQVEVIAESIKDIEQVQAIDIQSLATLFGEDDIVKYLVTLPGISNINSFDAGISVRGGSTTENAFLVDGVRIAEPKHISTLVTAFDPYVLDKAEVYKGGFPSLYNGRLSGYVDMGAQPELEETELSVSAGIISSSLKFGAVLGENNSHRVKFSARQSYLHLVSSMYERREKIDQIPEYGLRDFTLSYEWSLNEKWALSLFGLSSSDDLPLTFSNGNRNDLKWKANSGVLGLRRNFSGRGEFSIHVGYNESRSDYANITSSQFIESTSDNFSTTLRYTHNFNNHISILTGYRFEHSSFFIEEGRDDQNKSEVSSDLHSAFADWLYFPKERWSFTLGANLSYFDSKASFIDLAPRAKIQHYFNNFEFWLDYARTNQYEEKLPFFTIRSPIDIPVPLGENNRSAISDQISLGTSWQVLNDVNLTVVPFYKYMQHVKDFSSNSRANLDFNSIQMLEGIGESYGVETSLNWKSDWVETSFNYTYLKSIRLFDEINEGEIFSPPFDITSNISTSIVFRLNSHWSATAFWTYASGIYVTIPEGIIVAKDLTDPNSIVNYVPVYGDRYNYRLPARHRLDLGINYRTDLGPKTSIKLSGGTYNTYNRQNADFVYFEVERNDEFFVSFVPRSKMVLPFVPYLSLSFFFN